MYQCCYILFNTLDLGNNSTTVFFLTFWIQSDRPILRPFCNTVLADRINQKIMEVIAEGNMVYPKCQTITYWCIIRMKRAKYRCIEGYIFLSLTVHASKQWFVWKYQHTWWHLLWNKQINDGSPGLTPWLLWDFGPTLCSRSMKNLG